MSDDDSSKSNKPKLQPEVDRGGSGRPPRKTAIGYFSEGEDDDSHKKSPNLKYGQRMVVRTLAPVIDGYRVKIRNTDVEAVLKTNKVFQINILLVVIFKEFTNSGTPIFILSRYDQVNYVDGKPILRRFHSENIDKSRFSYKRRSDSLPMSFGTGYAQIDFEETNVRRFISQISEPNFNGCVKFSSKQLLARGYLIMMGGRCTGAEYRSASDNFDRGTEGSIANILENLVVEDAVVQVFHLQREILLAMSAPFFGEFDSWHLDKKDDGYVKTILDWFKFGTSRTGLVYFQSEIGAAWAGFFQGRFIGFFDIEKQTFRSKTEFLDRYIELSRELDMQTYVLPDLMTISNSEPGFKLAEF
ncbi:MAG: hypothetical protein KIT34_06075 [Cyanobacteria bacterium TGS_CYA1]|nr:hypothetical protein [Cyanobacteria bacterium TGS_CYA1]